MERAEDEDEARGMPRVVIVGGGFGGLHVAKKLRRAEVEVCLVDRENFHLFQPLLYQVATAGLQAGDIASPIRAVLRRQDNTKVIKGEVHDIDRKERRVFFEHGEIDYDYLVLAAGMQTNYFGNDEWRKLAPGLKTLGDGLECRRRILEAFEQAEWTDDDDLAEALLTFVIVGAGPTGVEMAGAISEIAHEVMVRDFRNIDSSKARVVLVDADSRVLSAYHDETSEQAKRDLEAMGVEVVLDSMVKDITDEGVHVGDRFIRSHTVIWAAGVAASPLGATLDAELDNAGRVVVGPNLSLADDDRVFVIGDLAHAAGEDGEALPGLAPVAIQQGIHTARNIRRRLKGKEYRPFIYRDKGQMATLGRARAVAEIGKQRFSGFLAWMLWLFIHLLFLVGFRNRLFVLLDWFYAYVGMRRSSRLIVETPESYQQERQAERRQKALESAEGEIAVFDDEELSEKELHRRAEERSGGE